VPPKKTIEEHAQEQGRFLSREREPCLKEARAGRSAVFFLDAAHFVWAPFLCWLRSRGRRRTRTDPASALALSARRLPLESDERQSAR
jgi:hypothetical protein